MEVIKQGKAFRSLPGNTYVKNHCADDTALNTGGSVTGALRDVCEQSCNERPPTPGSGSGAYPATQQGQTGQKILTLNRKD